MEIVEFHGNTGSAKSNEAHLLLLFTLDTFQFAIWSNHLNAITRLVEITPAPGSSDYLAGMVNLRGLLLPVLDLKALFRFSLTRFNEKSRIIAIKDDIYNVCILVDHVSGFFQVNPGELQEPPKIVSNQFVASVYRSGENLISVLDITKLLSAYTIEESDGQRQNECIGENRIKERIAVLKKEDNSKIDSNLAKLRQSFDYSFTMPLKTVTVKHKRFLVFTLAQRYYAVSLDFVQEVLKLPHITKVPCAPASIAGIMNLKGMIVSVSIIHSFFDLPSTPPSPESRVFITKNLDFTTAILVDSIVNIALVEEEELEPSLFTTDKDKSEYITGKFRDSENIVTLLDMEALAGSQLMRIE